MDEYNVEERGLGFAIKLILFPVGIVLGIGLPLAVVCTQLINNNYTVYALLQYLFGG